VKQWGLIAVHTKNGNFPEVAGVTKQQKKRVRSCGILRRKQGQHRMKDSVNLKRVEEIKDL
jgi:hypothetical protein